MSGDGNDTAYETIAFWSPAMPHWVHLSPEICHAFETLLDHRPRYPNVITADAVETLAHETMHSVGVSVEAQASATGCSLRRPWPRSSAFPLPTRTRLRG